MFIFTDLPKINIGSLNSALINQQIAEFRKAVRADPADEAAHYGLGVAYFNLGLVEDSARELRLAAELMPENPHIQLQLATAYAKLAVAGEDQLVRPAFDRVNRALKLRPAFLEAIALRAKLHRFRGDYSDAVSDWSRVAKENPSLVQEPATSFLNRHKVMLGEARLERNSATIYYVPLEDARAPEPQIWGFNTENVLRLTPLALFFLAMGVVSIFTEEDELSDSGARLTWVILALAGLSLVWVIWRYFSQQKAIHHTMSESQPALFADLLSGAATIDETLHAAEYVADSLEFERAERIRNEKRATEEESERLRKRDELLAQSLKAAKKNQSGCTPIVILFVVVLNGLLGYAFLLRT